MRGGVKVFLCAVLSLTVSQLNLILSTSTVYGFKEGVIIAAHVCACVRVCVCRVGRACSCFLWQSYRKPHSRLLIRENMTPTSSNRGSWMEWLRSADFVLTASSCY